MSVSHPTDLLAAYALDALTEDERVAVQAHVAGCDECRRAVARHRAVTEVLAMSVPPEGSPSTDLRERILRESARTPQVRPLPVRRPDRYRGRVPGRLVGWLAAAVLFVSTVGLGVWDLSLHQQLQSAPSPQSSAVALAATADAPGASGQLSPGTAGGDVVTVINLPPTGAGQVYEAWVIDAAGPKPAGTFLTTTDGRGAVVLTHPAASGQVVAITAEPAPGVPAPTGKVLLKGSVA